MIKLKGKAKHQRSGRTNIPGLPPHPKVPSLTCSHQPAGYKHRNSLIKIKVSSDGQIITPVNYG